MDLTKIQYADTASLVRKGKIGLLGLVKNSTFSVNSLFKALTPIKHHLQERQIFADEIAGLVNDTPILFEGFVDDLTTEEMGSVTQHLPLTKEEFHRVMGLIEALSNQEENGFTGTLANGTAFALKIVNETSETGDEILVKTAGNVVNMSSAFLYKTQDGLFKLNPIITPIGWTQDVLSDALIDGLSILEILQETLKKLEPDTEVFPESIQGQLISLSPYCRASQTSFDNIYDHVVHLLDALTGFVPTGLSLKELVVALSKSLIAEYDLLDVKSKKIHILTYFKDMLVSSSIQQVLIEGVDAIRGGFDAITTFLGSVDSWIHTAAQSVQHVYKVLVKAFQQGGIVGMASAIVQLYSSPTNTILSEDGILQFTNNEKLMPREYIAGIIAAVVTVLGAITSLIVAIFSPIIGAIVSAVGYVVYGIFKSFTMDWNGTYCQAEVSSSGEVVDYFPVGLFQTEVSFADTGMEDEDLLPLANQLLGANYVVVPGGMLLIGASLDEQVFRFEFHPGIYQTRFDLLFKDKLIEYEIIQPTQSSMYHGFLMKGRHYPVLSIDIFDTLRYLEVDPLTIDGEGYYTGLSDDYLGVSYSSNVAAFLLFLKLVQDHGSDLSRYRVPSSGYFGNMGIATWRDGTSTTEVIDFRDNLYALFYSPLARQFLVADDWTQPMYNAFNGVTSWADVVQFAIDSRLNDIEDAIGPNFKLVHVPLEQWNDATIKLSDGGYSIDPALLDNPVTSYTMNGYAFADILVYGLWAGSITDVTSNMLWAVKMPKWNRSTFIGWILLAGLVTTVVVATTALVAVKVRKTIRTARAESARRVENAWNEYRSADTPEKQQAAYKSYSKAVKRANFKAKFIGGTRYDASGYWNGDPTESQESAGGETTEKISGINRVLGLLR